MVWKQQAAMMAAAAHRGIALTPPARDPIALGAAQAAAEMIVLQQVHKRLGHTPVLAGIDLHIAAGGVTGLIGRSGAGKSTLLRCINLLVRPDQGNVRVDGVDLTRCSARDLQAMRRRIGFVFQQARLLEAVTALDNVMLPLQFAKCPDARGRALNMLACVDMAEHAHKYPAQLSGGQKQRVGIARALVQKPDILLCDEATAALDPASTQAIMALLRALARDFSLTMVVVSHDMAVVQALCEHVLVLHGGTIVESGKPQRVLRSPTHPATRALLGTGGEDDRYA